MTGMELFSLNASDNRSAQPIPLSHPMPHNSVRMAGYTSIFSNHVKTRVRGKKSDVANLNQGTSKLLLVQSSHLGFATARISNHKY